MSIIGRLMQNVPLKIAVFYILISTIWTTTSDFIMLTLHLNDIYWIDASKGVIFIMVTGYLIYILVKRNIKGLREREEELHTLIDAMPDFVNFKDAEGRWIKVNQYGLELFELENVPFKGKTDSELADYTDFYRDSLMYCEKSDEEVWKIGRTVHVEEVIPQRNGEDKLFDTIKVPLFHPDGSRKGFVVIGREVTQRKKVERQLDRSEQLYRSLFENNNDGICTIDLNGKIINVNEAAERITGFCKDEIEDRLIWDFIEKGQFKHIFNHFKLAKKGTSSVITIKGFYKDGHPLILGVKDVPIKIKGKLVGFFAIFKDLTDLKRNEELVRKSEKLSVVGELASSVAHEIRNPLTSIKGFLQILQQEKQSNKMYFDIMLSEIDRINLIVGEFMILSKPHLTNYKEKDVNELLQNVITLLQTLAIMKNIEIVTEFESDANLIKCEENQVKQIFINILKNAIEAVKDGGKIKVKVDKSIDRKCVIIRFIDNGCGISKSRIPKLGEPFYTTKEKGTGLGLMVSFKIIQEHGGLINIKSKEKMGTVVEVAFPVIVS